MKQIYNPSDEWYVQYLKPYYIKTKDNQYLFGSTQPGRLPSRAFYVVPEGYRLGKSQQLFKPGTAVCKKLYGVIKQYLKGINTLVVDGIQGEAGYETGLRMIFSLQNPHSAYMAWMAKQMVFPYKKGVDIHCWNYIVPESLPADMLKKIKEFFPDFEPPITLYDLTDMDKDIRRVVSIGMDYFGGAIKKPNLTMVWNRGEEKGMISYHAGATQTRILKGLSGTGKTTLTVGENLEQDDACLGKPYYSKGKVSKLQIIGLEAASFAKSEGLVPTSPEWPGVMKSKEIGPDGKHPIVLAMNVDCRGVEYRREVLNGYKVKVPRPVKGEKIRTLDCTHYEKSETTNGRVIFLFSVLNKKWGSKKKKWLSSESLSFKRFDVLEPMFRVTDFFMAVALDSACESIITSAVGDKPVGTRVRSYAATDFMAREQSEQALLKLKVYSELGLGDDGELVFFINNAGYVGKLTLDGKEKSSGEKIKVEDSKKLVHLVETKRIKKWIKHPIYGYLIPDPKELEEKHGMKDFCKRFNPLRFYTPEEIIRFARRDIKERTEFLENLFKGQQGEEKLRRVVNVWKKCRIPKAKKIRRFYEKHYGKVK